MTTYEQKIYAVINGSTEHLTVEQIFEQVKMEYPKVVLATIYNNVNKLWKAGLIRKVSVAGTPDRYDCIQRHDHLVCRRCGRLVDIQFQDLTASLQDAIGDAVLFYDLKVFYLCADCKKQLNSNENI